MTARFKALETTMYLDNSGSVARDHLANERTFLAWVRTSLGTAGVGLGLAQLYTHAWAKPLGSIFVSLGIIFTGIAVWRYFNTQSALVKGQFPASRSGVVFVTLAIMGALTAVLVAIVVIIPNKRSSS